MSAHLVNFTAAKLAKMSIHSVRIKLNRPTFVDTFITGHVTWGGRPLDVPQTRYNVRPAPSVLQSKWS